MIWSIETDDFHGACGKGSNPLLNAINTALKNWFLLFDDRWFKFPPLEALITLLSGSKDLMFGLAPLLPKRLKLNVPHSNEDEKKKKIFRHFLLT
uniref:SFRICE_026424 n=1 Tax=Spodoptera frugiperda TaxID=7108 RepID=A0A2H1WMA2_SPOFR